jgi:hypothetical protein
MAIFAALALLDPQQHALGIDIADLERDDLGDAQPGAPRVRPSAGPRTGFDREKARRAVAGILETSKGLTLGGLRIKDLVNEGRP